MRHAAQKSIQPDRYPISRTFRLAERDFTPTSADGTHVAARKEPKKGLFLLAPGSKASGKRCQALKRVAKAQPGNPGQGRQVAEFPLECADIVADPAMDGKRPMGTHLVPFDTQFGGQVQIELVRVLVAVSGEHVAG